MSAGIMWFQLRKHTNSNAKYYQLEGREDSLKLAMDSLFSSDDYVFQFDNEPKTFKNVSPYDFAKQDRLYGNNGNKPNE